MVVRITGQVLGGRLELSGPVQLPDGTDVEVVIHSADQAEVVDWHELGMRRLEEEWNNPDDAIYDDWKTIYGV